MIENDLIDEKTVRIIMAKIIAKERENLKTKKFKNAQMVDMIIKVIEEEVDCY